MRNRSATRYRRLEAECDGLIQEVARLMFRGRCAFGCEVGTAGHHVIGRSNKVYRHEPLNIVYVCQGHHDMLHGLITDQNKDYFYECNVLTTTINLISLFERNPGTSAHYDFWNRARHEQGTRQLWTKEGHVEMPFNFPIWETELEVRRDVLKQIIKNVR